MSEFLVDLSANTIQAFINNGYGITNDGVSNDDGVIVFNIAYKDTTIFPMFAVDFHDYLVMNGIHMEEVKGIEMVAAAYDAEGREIDFSEEYQKCAFVSADALNGYSASDILPQGNYKILGSNIVTKFDLTKYTGYASDGVTLSNYSLEDGVGFNVQFCNGDHASLTCFVISSLKLIL